MLLLCFIRKVNIYFMHYVHTYVEHTDITVVHKLQAGVVVNLILSACTDIDTVNFRIVVV